MIPQLGLGYEEEILVALPHIFNYEDNERMKKINGLAPFVSAVCDDLYQNLSKVRHKANYNLITKRILPTAWPLLMRKADPQKFNEHLKYLKGVLQLGPEHACFMVHYSKKFPDKYPEFCIKHTLEHFSKLKIKYDLLTNLIVGEECIETLMSILRFNVHREAIVCE